MILILIVSVNDLIFIVRVHYLFVRLFIQCLCLNKVFNFEWLHEKINGFVRVQTYTTVRDPARSSGDLTSSEVRAGARSLCENVDRGPPAPGGPGPRRRRGPFIGLGRVAGLGWTRDFASPTHHPWDDSRLPHPARTPRCTLMTRRSGPQHPLGTRLTHTDEHRSLALGLLHASLTPISPCRSPPGSPRLH
jgi:hypothetical protein